LVIGWWEGSPVDFLPSLFLNICAQNTFDTFSKFLLPKGRKERAGLFYLCDCKWIMHLATFLFSLSRFNCPMGKKLSSIPNEKNSWRELLLRNM
jgi:hypothetical protein